MTIKNRPKNCCSTVDEKPAELGSTCLLHRTGQRWWCSGSHEKVHYIFLQGKEKQCKIVFVTILFWSRFCWNIREKSMNKRVCKKCTWVDEPLFFFAVTHSVFSKLWHNKWPKILLTSNYIKIMIIQFSSVDFTGTSRLFDTLDSVNISCS